jgi:hypothetical protein
MAYNFRRQGKYRAIRGWYDENLQPTDKAHGRWYFRSLLEVKCARYLNTLIKSGVPIVWRYGRKEMHNGHWDFNERVDKPFKSNSQYTLDFEVSYIHTGETYWIEVKGALQGIAKIRRAVKHFPERELRVFTTDHGMEPVANYLNRIDLERNYRKKGIPDLIQRVRDVRKKAIEEQKGGD